MRQGKRRLKRVRLAHAARAAEQGGQIRDGGRYVQAVE